MVFPQCIYYLLVTKGHDCMYYLSTINAIQCSVLQVLHIYWFFLIAGMMLHKIKTGKAEDLQSRKVGEKTKTN
jgi:cytochrome b subunit of formate dehydrogenase